MRFTAVYHVATLNHWREVVAEQLRVLLRNVDIADLFVTIGAESTQIADECAALIATSIQSSGRGLALRTWARWLDEFEHPAMARCGLVLFAASEPMSRAKANERSER